jgi:hypothetical protein
MTLPLAFSELENTSSNSLNNSVDDLDKCQQARRNNKTFKRRDNPKVNSVFSIMHEEAPTDDSDLGVFPPKPESSGLERIETFKKEPMVNMTSNNDQVFRALGKEPKANDDNNQTDLNDYSNYGDEKTNEEYYKRMLPGYSQQKQMMPSQNSTNKPYYSQMNYTPQSNEDSVLLQKMNYMITLLEDQQDERTNNVTEEVILYSFLGIFIIFVADTFVRAGKYVR